jgi:ABC-2 type transport system ATP-binding protein
MPSSTSAPDRSAAATAGISVRGLSKNFGAQQALQPLHLELEPGQIVGLIGPNGSGKSTFLRLLVGLLSPTSGAATVAGAELRGDGLAVRQRATFAPGEIACYPELTGWDQLDWFLSGRARAAQRRGRELMERLGLPGHKRLREYSHGMKRQLMFAAALAPDVPVRILDEPTEGLDPTKRGEVLAILAEDAGPGRTLLLSSHHLGEVDRGCARLLFLNQGRLIADERAADLAERARRLVRLGYRNAAEAQALEQHLNPALASGQLRSLKRHGERLTVELSAPDPRALLARLEGGQGLACPQRIEYGQLSLPDLYRDLYGVEGL